MKIIKQIVRLLFSPIEHFWEKVEVYKETNEYGKMVAAFAASFLITTAMVLTLGVIIILVIAHHIEIVLIVGIIAWIYWAVKKYIVDKKDNQPPSTKDTTINEPNKNLLKESAWKGYAPMRTIMLQTLRRAAPDIGGKTPRTPTEIEVRTDKIIVEDNSPVCFYQFRLTKQDKKTLISENDLVEFNSIIQSTFRELWQSGKFIQISMQSQVDQYGNLFDPVIIDRIDDYGDEYLIQTVFTSPAYIELVHMYWQNQNSSQSDGYDPTDSRFL